MTGQAFRVRDRRTGQPVHMENLLVTWHPDRTERILIGAHYDTRPYPDRDPVDPRGVFLGANDGASGVAVLMELGRFMARRSRARASISCSSMPRSMWLAREIPTSSDRPTSPASMRRPAGATRGPVYRCGVIVDMVADRDLAIWQERKSITWPDTRPVVESIWAWPRRLGVRQFVPQPRHEVEDDHVPLRNDRPDPHLRHHRLRLPSLAHHPRHARAVFGGVARKRSAAWSWPGCGSSGEQR